MRYMAFPSYSPSKLCAFGQVTSDTLIAKFMVILRPNQFSLSLCFKQMASLLLPAYTKHTST